MATELPSRLLCLERPLSMDASHFYYLKRFLRLCDSRFCRRQESVHFGGEDFRFFETYWWPNASQPIFEQEIGPYFEVLDSILLNPSLVLDVGAASGHFAIPIARRFPEARVICFEPALRQRLLLKRNAALNKITNFQVESVGLWNKQDLLAFRTNGAESSFASVSRFAGSLPFPEQVPVITLDQWASEHRISSLDLLKADVEGAELAMLEGGRETLQKFHPQLLIQAYHTVDGSRTFERCAAFVEKLGYRVAEPHPGLLYAS